MPGSWLDPRFKSILFKSILFQLIQLSEIENQTPQGQEHMGYGSGTSYFRLLKNHPVFLMERLLFRRSSLFNKTIAFEDTLSLLNEIISDIQLFSVFPKPEMLTIRSSFVENKTKATWRHLCEQRFKYSSASFAYLYNGKCGPFISEKRFSFLT